MIFGLGFGGGKNHFFEKLKNYKDFSPISDPPRRATFPRRLYVEKMDFFVEL